MLVDPFTLVSWTVVFTDVRYRHRAKIRFSVRVRFHPKLWSRLFIVIIGHNVKRNLIHLKTKLPLTKGDIGLGSHSHNIWESCSPRYQKRGKFLIISLRNVYPLPAKIRSSF